MKKTLILGYGNDSRNDDGVGWFVVRELSKRNLIGVRLETAHQLEVDMAEQLADYDEVIFVDAAVPESPRRWWTQEVEPMYKPRAVAHFMAPGDLLGLCQKLYGRAPRARLFSIRGRDFDFGTELSPDTRAAALDVVEAIVSALTEKERCHA